jgi:hypothetical protein
LLGGGLRDNYSHYFNSISELTSTNAPNLFLMNILYTISNVLILFFGIGLSLNPIPLKNKKITMSGILFIGLILFLVDLFV